jgi:hypothetical protein
MTEKTLPTVLRRGLLALGFCYLSVLTMPVVSWGQALTLGLCLLLLEANFGLFLSVCALANSDAKRFFLWAARLRLAVLLVCVGVVALHPASPCAWMGWSWLIGPFWWISHVLAGAALYLVYEEYRLGGSAWLALVAPFGVGLLLLNPLQFPLSVVLLGALLGSAFQALLCLWASLAGPR